MLFFRKVWKLASELHPAFWVVPFLIVGVLVGLLTKADDKISPAVITLFGVVIGGALTTASALVVAKATQRVQLTASIWPQRLKAHQEAFTHWTRCSTVIFGDENQRHEVLNEARNWWNENCLYLSNDASKSFFEMLIAVHLHHDLVEIGKGQKDPDHRPRVETNFSKIMKAGPIISEGAGQHISDTVIREISEAAQKSSAGDPR